MLEMHNISFAYEKDQEFIINALSLKMNKGEIGAILGPSGCGKSTTLRLIAGLETPHSGRISIEGAPIYDDTINLEPHKRNIGFLFQDYCLFPHLTVEQNIGFALHKLEKGLKKKRVSELLTLIDLQEHSHKYPHQLSGGQQQRVALARAIANRPSLLLMDEPFSNLDHDLRVKLREDLKTILKAENVTCLLVTHDIQDVNALADCVFHL